MTNELEKRFFDTFGIEQRQRKACVVKNVLCPTPKVDCDDCFYFQYVPEYPYISNRALLELICILHTTNIVQLCTTNIEDLKEEILMTACCWVDRLDIKHKVRTLFEEG